MRCYGINVVSLYRLNKGHSSKFTEKKIETKPDFVRWFQEKAVSLQCLNKIRHTLF